MTRRLRAACGVLLLALLAPGGDARGQERLFAVERLLPGDAGAGVRLEAALLVRDLRAQRALALAQRDRLRRTPAGAAFLDPASLKRDFGFDWLEEAGRLVELGAPKGKPLPAGAALFSGPDGFGVQLILDAAPGFTARLEQAMRAGAAPAAFRSVANGLMRLEIGGKSLVGREDAGGAVRFAPAEAMLGVAAGGAPLFSGSLAARVRDCSEVLYFPGGGKLAEKLAGRIGKGAVTTFLLGARGLAFGLAGDGAGTSEARLILDHPLLEQLGPLFASPDAGNPFFALWGEQASAFYALRLPQAVVTPALFALAGELAKAKHPPPPALLEALHSFDGRAGIARFGSPGDWAIGLHFADEQTPAALVPALETWLDAIGEAEQIALLRSLVREALPGTTAATLTFGPDAGLTRIGITNVGRALVVTPQPLRRRALAAPPAKGKKAPASPLTAPLRAALAQPSLLTGYQVLGNELSYLGGTGWFSLVMRETLRGEARKSGKSTPLLDAVTERLPALLALANARFDLTYDSLLRADVEGSCVVLQAFSSDLPAKGKYFDAVNRRLAGDPAGYHDGLIAVAGKDPGSREGRRARAALLYNPFSDITTLGVLAAVAVPNFLNFREKAKRAAEPEAGAAGPDGSLDGQPPDDGGGDDGGGIEDDEGGAIPDDGEDDDGSAPPTEEQL